MHTQYVMPTYGRKSVCFTKGNGMWLEDSQGNTYMDLVSGVAVNCLGHGSEVIQNALMEQASKVVHISNLYWNEPQLKLSQKLIELSDGHLKDVFFCNSGTEALEAAIKLCKKYGKSKEKPLLVYMNNSFHGRTSGALSITGQPKYQEPFGSLLPDCLSINVNEEEALESIFKAYGPQIAAVFIEPIQGEGGVIKVTEPYLKKLSDLCQVYDALLVFDEVQCGAGRIGTYYAYQSTGVVPDLVCMAKGLGGGVPIGAVLASEKASVFSKGDHGSTYGGNPLVCHVALAVTNTISEQSFLNRVKAASTQLVQGLEKLKAEGKMMDFRGEGLLLAIVHEDTARVVDTAFEEHLLLISAGANAIRILPPLNVSETEIELILKKLDQVLTICKEGASA